MAQSELPFEKEVTSSLDTDIQANTPNSQHSVATNRDAHIMPKLRALLHAAPLLSLHFGEDLRSDATNHYDTLLLALKSFDLIVENTGLDTELDAGQLLTRLSPTLARMDKAAQKSPNEESHENIMDFVLSRLRGDVLRIEEYTDLTEEPPQRRRVPIQLLQSTYLPDDRIGLRLTPQALNLFLTALDLDIEDVQVATDALVQSQLKRGKFDEAAKSARQASLASIEYKLQIEDIVRQTRRDYTELDWHEEVPQKLKKSLEHIEQRQQVENSIISVAEEHLEDLPPGSSHAQSVASVLRLMRECSGRHASLLPLLIQARVVFLNEQVRQDFRPALHGYYPHLQREVLEPILKMPRVEAQVCIEHPSLPPVFQVPHLISWSGLLARHFQSPRADVADVFVEERELTTGSDAPPRYPLPVRQTVEERLTSSIVTQEKALLLSYLLETAQAEGNSLEHLELLALEEFRVWGAENSAEDKALWYAEQSNTDIEIAGFAGNDLWLLPALTASVDTEQEEKT